MKFLALALFGLVAVSACSTATDLSLPMPAAEPSSEAADASWVEQNGPSPTPREGWVETVSGWYRSREACLEDRNGDAVGTPLSREEECLEVGGKS